jgi:hypothetical protein
MGNAPVEKITRRNMPQQQLQEEKEELAAAKTVSRRKVLKQKLEHGLVSLEKFSMFYVWFYMLVVMTVLFATVGSYAWTTKYIPKSTYPQYADVAGWKAEMWNAEHVMLLLNIPMYIIPALTFVSVVHAPYTDGLFIFHFIIVAVIMIMWGVGLFIYNAIKWGECHMWAVCVNDDPFGDSNSPVIYWYFIFFGHLAVFLMMVPLLLIAAALRKHFAQHVFLSRKTNV